MNLLNENAKRLQRLRDANIPDSALADTINFNHGYRFTADGIRQIGDYLGMAHKKMVLTKVQENLFMDLVQEPFFKDLADLAQEGLPVNSPTDTENSL